MSTLPPDPEGMNDDRARWAGETVLVFRMITGTEPQDALQDLLCDLMHWADRHGIKFDDELQKALAHYVEETRE